MITLTRLFKTLAILIITSTLSCCTSDASLESDFDKAPDIAGQGDKTNEDKEVIEWMDEALEKCYLYNEEYKTSKRDKSLSYNNFLYSTLMKLSTNELDKKYYERYKKIYLFSYVTRSKSTSSRASSSSREQMGYGFVDGDIVDDNGTLAIAIYGVYKDSPAAELGITRGMTITHINGEEISLINYATLFDKLLYPSNNEQTTITINSSEKYTLTAKSIETNPILHHEILDHHIGYLVYSQFNKNFDNDLEQTLNGFVSAGVKDLILDLRINPGGYVSSSILLSSIIAGDYATNKIFSYYLLNNDLTTNYSSTASLSGWTYNSANKAFYERFKETKCKLTTPRIYCLVSDKTASASELLINALRGIDFEVILIGSQTLGKNVGMFIFKKQFDGYDYELGPISFENRNSKMEGKYEDGMEVDYKVNDLHGFCDYNTNDQMVAKALELITGTQQNYNKTRATTQHSITKLDCKTPLRREYGSLVEIRK